MWTLMTERFRVGVIASMHGLKGEVKVFPTTDEPERFRLLKEVILDMGPKGERVLRIRSCRFFKGMVILGFEGLARIEDVQPFKGMDLLIDRKDALPLAEGEHYIPDLIGLTVYEEEDGSAVGVLEDVMETGANSVYVVRTPEGRELLLPKIPDCIKEVSPEEGRIVAHVLPGLRDL